MIFNGRVILSVHIVHQYCIVHKAGQNLAKLVTNADNPWSPAAILAKIGYFFELYNSLPVPLVVGERNSNSEAEVINSLSLRPQFQEDSPVRNELETSY
jgi:hypothetical protein